MRMGDRDDNDHQKDYYSESDDEEEKVEVSY
jgi:hypothetical protein